MCTVLLPPGGYQVAVNKYIISYNIISYQQLRKKQHILCNLFSILRSSALEQINKINWISSVSVCYSCVTKNEIGNMETFPSVSKARCWNKKWALKMWCHIPVLMQASSDSWACVCVCVCVCLATCHNSLNRSNTSHGFVCWIQEGYGPADGCWIKGCGGVTPRSGLGILNVGY